MAIQNVYPKGYTAHVDVDVHQNGKLAYLIVNKTETVNSKSQRNIRIVEVDIPTKTVVREIKVYREGTDMQGPAGYCSIKCLPNGSLFIGLAIASASNPNEIVAAFDILENVIPVFDSNGSIILPPPVTTNVDQVARDMAAKALVETVKIANQLQAYATKAALFTAMNDAKIHTDTAVAPLPTKDYVWSNIADRITVEIVALGTDVVSVFENDVFKRYIRTLATEALVVAINYARTNPNQSSLRKLIEDVIAGN